MKPSFFKSGVAAMTAASLLLPSASFALTPSQWFNQLVRAPQTESAIAADATIDINVAERFYAKSRKGSTGSVNVSMALRTPQATAGMQTSEGLISLNKFKMEGTDLGLPFTINEPIAFEWKQTSDMVFVRVTKVPASLLDYAKELSSIDYSGLIGKWIGFPFSQKSLLEDAGITGSDTASDAINKGPLAKTQLVIGVRKEKTFKNAAGEEIIRVTGRLNPAIATILYQEQVKQIKKDWPAGTYRTERLKDAYKEYLKSLAALRGIYLAANINTVTKKFERIEFSAKVTEPKEECTWNSTYTKETCKAVGSHSLTTVKGGINLSTWCPSGSTR
ncbi:MAG: hypothetical protein U0487_03265 [Patescibacteria group bacterium]